MKLKLIACKVMMRELYWACARSQHVVEIIWMDAALHENPSDLRAAIQRVIDEIEAQDDPECDALLLGYGLCSMGIVGLKTHKLPLIVPRAHDCITVILGSRARYQTLFDAYGGGVYWYSAGWIEQMSTPGRGYGDQEKYMDYVEKYGEDNAQYLIEVERGWTQNYQCAALITWPELPGNAHYEAVTRAAAEQGGLTYVEAPGDKALIEKLVNGCWDADFLTLEPGQTLAYSGDGQIICAQNSA